MRNLLFDLFNETSENIVFVLACDLKVGGYRRIEMRVIKVNVISWPWTKDFF